MKNLWKSLRITIAFCMVLGLCYVLVLWLFAQVAAPGEGGNAETVMLNGKAVGAANVGQVFSSDKYFWGRPSNAGDGYDAASSAGSNKGPYLQRKDVPAEMVTASASGLDPHITPQSAYIQVKRVAEARGMSEDSVKAIVDGAVEKPLLNMFGPAKVNVLKLNVALDKVQK